jgi:hypothetical protein
VINTLFLPKRSKSSCYNPCDAKVILFSIIFIIPTYSWTLELGQVIKFLLILVIQKACPHPLRLQSCIGNVLEVFISIKIQNL